MEINKIPKRIPSKSVENRELLVFFCSFYCFIEKGFQNCFCIHWMLWLEEFRKFFFFINENKNDERHFELSFLFIEENFSHEIIWVFFFFSCTSICTTSYYNVYVYVRIGISVKSWQYPILEVGGKKNLIKKKEITMRISTFVFLGKSFFLCIGR